MENQISVNYYNCNFYITLEVKKGMMTKFFLILVILTLLAAYISIVSNIETKEVRSLFVSVTIIFLFVFVVVLKTSLWNIYGKEHIVVNDKTISFLLDYGFYETRLTTIHHDRLDIRCHYDERNTNPKIGRIVFVNVRDRDGLEEILHSTSIRLNESAFWEFQNQFRLLTYKEFEFPNQSYISLN